MDVGGYRDNLKSFIEKFTYPMFINKDRMTIAQGTLVNLVETLFFSLSEEQ